MKSEYKTKITIFCKDNSTRVITCEGRYSLQMATDLGRDLEGDNFFRVEILIQ